MPTSPPVALGSGKAQMSMSNLGLQDYFSIPNALLRFQNPVSVGASCSFDLEWSGPVTSKEPVTTPGSSGELVNCQATMTWWASNDLGFSFVSDPTPTTNPVAQLSRVKDGVFA